MLREQHSSELYMNSKKKKKALKTRDELEVVFGLPSISSLYCRWQGVFTGPEQRFKWDPGALTHSKPIILPQPNCP